MTGNEPPCNCPYPASHSKDCEWHKWVKAGKPERPNYRFIPTDMIIDPEVYVNPVHLVKLADEIKRYGMPHPIEVKADGPYWKVVSGTKRFFACKKLNYPLIPCRIVSV